ncbi:alpha/beta fold hydrolase [Pseudonocardia ailaonensis]|uniref:alpha/beta fold hydrolase n=1 Tax=Pseudonocardia ailaonensis TaxID=367279 RepID=UPI0031D20BDA
MGVSPRTRRAALTAPTRRAAANASTRRAAVAALAAVVAVVALLLASCSVGPSRRPPVAVRGDGMTGPPPTSAAPAPADPNSLPLPQQQNPVLDYADCTADTVEAVAAEGYPLPPGRALTASCGQLAVPADPGRPTAGSTRLGVLRVSAPDAPRNRPALVVLGDSGGGGSARVAARLATLVSDAVLRQYQLVGLDRRGTGSDLLDCAPPAARAGITDTAPVTGDAGLSALLEQARSVVQDCYLQLDQTITTYRTASTVADLERLRTQLRVDRLNIVALGDGGTAAAAWAAAHPQSVGRIVIDSPLDPSTDEPERSERRAGAAEAAFDAFASSCLARGGCPLGADPRAAVTQIVRGLDARPLASADGDRVTAGGAIAAMRAGLGEPARWPALAAALAGAGSGDPNGLIGFLSPVLRDGGTFDGALAVTCNDSVRRLAPPEVAQLATRWGQQYPLFGAAAAEGLLACGPWPVSGGSPSVTPLPGTTPPVLVLGTAADLRAPLDGSKKVAQLLGHASFATWEGSAQGAYPRNACITALADQVLVQGQMPRDGTVCPA